MPASSAYSIPHVALRTYSSGGSLVPSTPSSSRRTKSASVCDRVLVEQTKKKITARQYDGPTVNPVVHLSHVCFLFLCLLVPQITALSSTLNPPVRVPHTFWCGRVWQSTFPPEVYLAHALFLLSVDMRTSGLMAVLASASVAEAFLPAPVISNSATLRPSSGTSASNVGRQARTAQYMVAAPAKEDTLAAVPHGGTLVDLNLKTDEEKKVWYIVLCYVDEAILWRAAVLLSSANVCDRILLEMKYDVLYDVHVLLLMLVCCMCTRSGTLLIWQPTQSSANSIAATLTVIIVDPCPSCCTVSTPTTTTVLLLFANIAPPLPRGSSAARCLQPT